MCIHSAAHTHMQPLTAYHGCTKPPRRPCLPACCTSQLTLLLLLLTAVPHLPYPDDPTCLPVSLSHLSSAAACRSVKTDRTHPPYPSLITLPFYLLHHR